MKKRYFLLIAVLLSTLTACKAKPPKMVGGD
jgi:predicted small lipoprotein YifL